MLDWLRENLAKKTRTWRFVTQIIHVHFTGAETIYCVRCNHGYRGYGVFASCWAEHASRVIEFDRGASDFLGRRR